jgi:DNA-binding transcriptional MerR regulator
MERAARALTSSPGGATETARATDEGGAELFTIGQVTRAFGLTPRTLRFYEQRGFLAPQRRGSVRLYTPADRERIALLLEGKRLGFTLREIGQLMAAAEAGAHRGALKLSRVQCVEQINLLERQKAAIETALSELRRTYSNLYVHALARERPANGGGGGEDTA